MKAYVRETGEWVKVRSDHVWTGVQRHLRTLHPRGKGLLTRISRNDHGGAYAHPGDFSVVFTHPTMGDYRYEITLAEVAS